MRSSEAQLYFFLMARSAYIGTSITYQYFSIFIISQYDEEKGIMFFLIDSLGTVKHKERQRNKGDRDSQSDKTVK